MKSDALRPPAPAAPIKIGSVALPLVLCEAFALMKAAIGAPFSRARLATWQPLWFHRACPQLLRLPRLCGCLEPRDRTISSMLLSGIQPSQQPPVLQQMLAAQPPPSPPPPQQPAEQPAEQQQQAPPRPALAAPSALRRWVLAACRQALHIVCWLADAQWLRLAALLSWN